MEPGGSYAFVDFFVYAPHGLLPTYTIRWNGEDRAIGHYRIDFRKMYKVDCDEVVDPKNTPKRVKRLQLSIDVRKQLREKLSHYFGRPAREDEL